MNQDNFIQLFGLDNPESLINWNDSSAVGFSVLKEYPDNIQFIPVKDRSGLNDSVCLIKIGYLIKNINTDEVALLISASKGSKYLFEHHFYDFNNSSGPTKESVLASERSKQPADLEEYSRFVFKISEGKFWDTEKNQYVSGSDLIEYIWHLHLKSITYLPFRSKLKFKKVAFRLRDYIFPILKSILKLIGWEINVGKDDFLIGFTKPYSFKTHMRKEESEKIVFLGIPVPKASTFIVMFFILTSLITKFYLNEDILRITDFIKKEIGDHQIFQLAFVIVVIYSVDFILPRIFVYLLNISILIRQWSMKPTKIS
jgi:hypothetical protein